MRSPESSDRLTTALRYAELGYKPIPCFGKVSAIRWKRFQQERPTEREIERWFSQGDYGVALVCGGLVVVDADSPAAVAEVLQHCGETPMRTATATPGHEHLYYRARAGVEYGNAVNIRGEEKTLRALGSYAVAPWSDGYRFIGELVPVKELPIIRVGHLRERKRYGATPRIERSGARQLVNDTIKNIRAYIRRIPSVQGQNGNKGLMRVCYLLAERFDYGVALRELEWWATEVASPPWPVEQYTRALNTAFRHKLKGTIS